MLCYFNHYFGTSSAFRGKSTAGDRSARRDYVQRAYDSVRALPYDVTLRVCGFKGQSLLPVDLDLTEIGDPQLIVYESIERMFVMDEQFDCYLNIEDDILVEAGMIETMLAFNRVSGVNEVFLPNRMEVGGNETSYCVDLVALPGWRGLNREFRGVQLDVARNPNSGLLFLSREQLDYARSRLDLGFRGHVIGGMMASAYSHAHSPFLLWRAKSDAPSHHVVHLDRWMNSPADQPDEPDVEHLTSPIQRPVGHVDSIRLSGIVCILDGWAINAEGAPLELRSLRLGDHVITKFRQGRNARPDVLKVFPHAALKSGFQVRFSLFDLPCHACGPLEIEIVGGSASDEFVLTVEPSRWPSLAVREALASAPRIPDQPLIPAAGQGRLALLLAGAGGYVEYGIGGSTILACRLQVPQIIGVESDENWLECVRQETARLCESSSLELVYVDVGPTGEWGYPASDAGWRGYSEYALAPWVQDGKRKARNSVDVILIDGRFRIACFLASMLFARPGVRVLFDDYFDRPHYASVEKFLQPDAQHDRLAEFVVPSEVDREKVWLELLRSVSDTL
jgi:hypothetical protein